MPGSDRKRNVEVVSGGENQDNVSQSTEVGKRARCLYDKSKPVCTLTEDQREKLERHVSKRFKVVKFLLFPDELGEYLKAMEDTGELDMAFRAMGAGKRTTEGELVRARCWNVTAETYCAMLAKLQKELIAKWENHVKGKSLSKHLIRCIDC